jgi:hypothetical protein
MLHDGPAMYLGLGDGPVISHTAGNMDALAAGQRFDLAGHLRVQIPFVDAYHSRNLEVPRYPRR